MKSCFRQLRYIIFFACYKLLPKNIKRRVLLANPLFTPMSCLSALIASPWNSGNAAAPRDLARIGSQNVRSFVNNNKAKREKLWLLAIHNLLFFTANQCSLTNNAHPPCTCCHCLTVCSRGVSVAGWTQWVVNDSSIRAQTSFGGVTRCKGKWLHSYTGSAKGGNRGLWMIDL